MSAEAHASFLIDLEAKKYADGLTRIESQTKGASTRMVADLDATTRATERLGTAAGRTSKGMYALGQTSMQLQDVAVQLQSGTKFATVFAQQGSQMASVFGPGGAVLGGVIAIGAAIYTWASGAKEAEKELKAVEKRLKSTEAAMTKVEGFTDSDNQAAANASGKQEGAAERYKQRLSDIHKEEQDVPFATGPNKTQNNLDREREAKFTTARTAARNRYIEELAKEKRETEAKAEQKQSIIQDKIEAEKAKLHDSQITDEANSMELTKSIGEAEVALRSGKLSPGQYDKTYLSQLKDQNELIAEGKRLNKEGLETQKEGVEEDKKWRAAFDKTIKQADEVAKLQEKRLDIEKAITTELKRQDVKRSMIAGEATLQGAAQHLKSPEQRAAERHQADREDRAVHREISDELDRRDHFSRTHGGGGLSPQERADIRKEREGDVNRTRNKEKILAEVSETSIEKLTDKLQDVLDKLLAK